MKKFFLTCLGLATALVALAQQSKIVTESISSEKLGAEIKYNVYVPAGYSAEQSYPVIYLLHGLYGTYSNWAEQGGMKAVTDELIGTGELRPSVIVMPQAGDADINNYQNGYFNVKDWPYEDFFFQELMPTVERKYNCGGSKGRRAVMGLSMGGGGTIVYAQRHPDLFSSAYGMSAWLDSQRSDPQDPAQKASKFYLTNESVCDHSALNFMDQADEATIGKLKTVKWFLDSGDDDSLTMLSVNLYSKMRQAGLPCELRVRNGAHNWEYWHTALRIALPFASREFRP